MFSESDINRTRKSEVNKQFTDFHSCHNFFSTISEIDKNFKGFLVKIREVLRNQLFRD